MALKPKSTNTPKNINNPTTTTPTLSTTKPVTTTKTVKKTTNGSVALKTKPKTYTRKTTATKKTPVVKTQQTTKSYTGNYVWPANLPQALPFFHIKFERYQSGIKLYLTSNSPEAVTNIQKYFQYYTGSMASINIMQNGIPWFNFNFAFGNWNWKQWNNGVCYWCNTSDKNYVKALHAWVELANWSLKYGSTFCLNFGGNPICCAYI